MGGVRLFIEDPTGGGGSRRGKGREGVCGELGNFGVGGGAGVGGVGLNIFLQARNGHQDFARRSHEANASPGAHSYAPERSSGAGRWSAHAT